MRIQATQVSTDDAISIVLVHIFYEDFSPEETTYLVTIDKILGHATVHCAGVTRRTAIPLDGIDNRAVAEERAIICAVYFPGEEFAS